jgi:predicted PurR-regulated permease PerM
VFFAIPLATLVNAVLRAWPKSDDETEPEAEAAT